MMICISLVLTYSYFFSFSYMVDWWVENWFCDVGVISFNPIYKYFISYIGLADQKTDFFYVDNLILYIILFNHMAGLSEN